MTTFYKKRIQSLLIRQDVAKQAHQEEDGEALSSRQPFPKFIACTTTTMWSARGGRSNRDLVTIESGATGWDPKYVRFCWLFAEDFAERSSQLGELRIVDDALLFDSKKTDLDEDRAAFAMANREYSKKFTIELDKGEWIDMADSITSCASGLNSAVGVKMTGDAFSQPASSAVFGLGFGRYINFDERFPDMSTPLQREALWHVLCVLPCLLAAWQTDHLSDSAELYSWLTAALLFGGAALAMHTNVHPHFRDFQIGHFLRSALAVEEQTTNDPTAAQPAGRSRGGGVGQYEAPRWRRDSLHNILSSALSCIRRACELEKQREELVSHPRHAYLSRDLVRRSLASMVVSVPLIVSMFTACVTACVHLCHCDCVPS